MPELKLGKLPDRTPVRITIAVPPDLSRSLSQYAEAYRDAYGQNEPVAELIPFMLEAFLKADRGFAKVGRGGESAAAKSSQSPSVRHPQIGD